MNCAHSVVWILIVAFGIFVSGCSQSSQTTAVAPVTVEPRIAKVVTKKEVATEQYSIARENLNFPRNIAGDFPTAKECATKDGYVCDKFWRNIETSFELFNHCMMFQKGGEMESSEETPRLCLQLYDVDGDFFVTLADYHYFQAFHDFRWTQLQGEQYGD